MRQTDRKFCTMTALVFAWNRIRAFLRVMDAALSAAAAVRAHHAPAARDLRRLGITPSRAAMDALSRA